MELRVIKFAYAAMLCLVWSASSAALADPVGTWLSQDGGTKVHITECGGKLCGTVVWLDKPIDPRTGKPKTDKLNPDPAKRSRPLIGLQVVHRLAPSGPDKWSGQIYNADDGRTYQASLTVRSGNAAHVEGCVLAVLCKRQTWTRTD